MTTSDANERDCSASTGGAGSTAKAGGSDEKTGKGGVPGAVAAPPTLEEIRNLQKKDLDYLNQHKDETFGPVTQTRYLKELAAERAVLLDKIEELWDALRRGRCRKCGETFMTNSEYVRRRP